MRGPDLFVLVAYFATMSVVGLVYSRQSSCDMYFAADRQLNWFLGGVSYFLSNLSAFAIIVYAGIGYEYGLVAVTLYCVTTVPTTILATLVFARRWRRTGVITPTEFLEKRFSPAMRQIIVWSHSLPRIADEALKLVAIGLFAAAGMKLSPILSIIVVGLTVMLYSISGGLWAVIVTVFVQFVLVAGAVTVLLPLSYQAAGGWQHFVSTVPKGFFSLVNGPYTWSLVFALFLTGTLGQSATWPLVQKFYSARSDSDARKVGWLAAFLYLVVPPIWIITGMFARGFFPSNLDPQLVYARISGRLLPVGMLGLIIAALFAPTMSALSSGYNVLASVLTVDVYQRLIKPVASQKELVIIGRCVTAFIAIIVLLLALVITYFHWSLFNVLVIVWGLFVPPTIIPVLAGLLTERLSARGAVVAFLGSLFVGAMLLTLNIAIFHNPMKLEGGTIITSIGATIGIIAISAIWFPAAGDEKQRVSSFFADLRRPSMRAESATAGPLISPTRIAGLVIGTMGIVLVVIAVGVFASAPRNFISLGMGILFTATGSAMAWPKGLRQRHHTNRDSATPVCDHAER